MIAAYMKRCLLALVLIAAASSAAQAHCQIPCGIYGDEARFEEMLEHVTTIEKSMNQINSLGAQEKPDWNQLVRWVDNKEHHADELSEIVTYYFMAQRIKPPKDHGDEAANAKYTKELSLLHAMLIHSMKAKQTTDLEQVKALRGLIEKFRASYMG
jgi:nickel superoxide dismutase